MATGTIIFWKSRLRATSIRPHGHDLRPGGAGWDRYRRVLEKFDHKNLNLDMENFRTLVPTTENLCLEIYRLLRDPLEQAGKAAGLMLAPRAPGRNQLEFI